MIILFSCAGGTVELSQEYEATTTGDISRLDVSPCSPDQVVTGINPATLLSVWFCVVDDGGCQFNQSGVVSESGEGVTIVCPDEFLDGSARLYYLTEARHDGQ